MPRRSSPDVTVPCGPSSTPAVVISAFRCRHNFTSEHLAVLLDLAPETLREYEAVGEAPPWVAYALISLGYELCRVVSEGAAETSALRSVMATPRSAAGPDGADVAVDVAL